MSDRVACISLFAPAEAATAEDRATGFRGVAYSGGVVPNFGWLGDIAIDLATMSMPDGDIPVLRNHDPNQIVGRARLSNDGQRLDIADGRFSEVTEHGREVAALMAEGHPWKLSVGISGRAQDTDRSAPIELNGRRLAVDAVFRKTRLLELSFVPAGADPNAYAATLSARLGLQPPKQGGDSMNELEQAQARIAELEAQVSSLTAQLATVTEERNTARAELSTAATARRNERIRALFGDTPNLTEAQLTAYRGMTDEQFAAVEALAATAAAAGNPDLFRQTAASGRTPEQGAPAEFAAPAGIPVDPERAQLHAKALKYQNDHPGTDYLTAVKAVAA